MGPPILMPWSRQALAGGTSLLAGRYCSSTSSSTMPNKQLVEHACPPPCRAAPRTSVSALLFPRLIFPPTPAASGCGQPARNSQHQPQPTPAPAYPISDIFQMCSFHHIVDMYIYVYICHSHITDTSVYAIISTYVV